MTSGTVLHTHLGTPSAQGINTRAEVGLLTRNIRIHGEMEPGCYDPNLCQWFDYDTFGGQTQVRRTCPEGWWVESPTTPMLGQAQLRWVVAIHFLQYQYDYIVA